MADTLNINDIISEYNNKINEINTYIESDNCYEKERSELTKSLDRYKQVILWLEELIDLRKHKIPLSEWNRKVIDHKNEVVCALDNTLMREEQYKKFLELALTDFKEIYNNGDNCITCKWYNIKRNCCDHYNYDTDNDESCDNISGWRYEDEVLKLMGDDTNVSTNEN